MSENIPYWVSLIFIITTAITITFFYYANGKPKVLTLTIIIWSITHSILSYNGFYKIINTIPPRFLLVLLPTLLLITYGLLPKQIAWVQKNRKTKISTFLHLVRIPVEIVLFFLFLNKMVPELMTFEGRNFDIIAGISAPIIGLLFLKKKINKKGLMMWNVIGLCLILSILINGVLSSELPFQQFGFEQPNKAVIYFPFILLPATIVPIVIYTHLTDILLLQKKP